MHKNLTIAYFYPPYPLYSCIFLLYILLTSQYISINFTLGRWYILYLPTHLPFLVFFIPLCRCRFSFRMISLLPEKLPLTFFIIRVCRWWILLAFVYLKKPLYCFYFLKRLPLGKDIRYSMLWRCLYTVIGLRFSEERSAVILIFIFLYLIFCWPMAAFKIFYWISTIRLEFYLP